jgi:hypothetical protein
VQVANLTCPQRWAQYLHLLRESIWPGGVLPKFPRPGRTQAQKAATEKQALQSLMDLLPGNGSSEIVTVGVYSFPPSLPCHHYLTSFPIFKRTSKVRLSHFSNWWKGVPTVILLALTQVIARSGRATLATDTKRQSCRHVGLKFLASSKKAVTAPEGMQHMKMLNSLLTWCLGTREEHDVSCRAHTWWTVSLATVNTAWEGCFSCVCVCVCVCFQGQGKQFAACGCCDGRVMNWALDNQLELTFSNLNSDSENTSAPLWQIVEPCWSS